MAYVLAAVVLALFAYSIWVYRKGALGADAAHERVIRRAGEKSVAAYKNARGRLLARARRRVRESDPKE